MFKANIKDNRTGVFIVNFEHISHLALVFLLSILNMWLMARFATMLNRNNYSNSMKSSTWAFPKSAPMVLH